jgi:2-polyprenyl-3-methyl-5-hydroxy-6-metoxy-1,4-benzoquinol methylase
MVDILNGGALSLAIAIGYRTGLFDILDSLREPRSAGDIAGGAGLSPRYVSEWLGIMAAGGIVELSSSPRGEDLFLLPEAHGDILARRAAHNNLGVYAQEIPLLTLCAQDAVMERFTTGDGIGYDHYPRFQAFMSELASAKHRRVLVREFLPSVDEGRMVKRLEEGIRVCDLGCAEGVALLLMARAFPNSHFTGIDLSEEAIGVARQEARGQGIANVELLVLDAATIRHREDLKGRFHYVTAFDSIHDQSRPLEALQGALHMLAGDGLFSMVDIAASSRLAENLDHPMGAFLYTVSLMHCMPVGLQGGGPGLGMMWGRQKAVAMLREAGFEAVTVTEIPNDPFNLHFLARPRKTPAGC